jgi:hypothetical protein
MIELLRECYYCTRAFMRVYLRISRLLDNIKSAIARESDTRAVASARCFKARAFLKRRAPLPSSTTERRNPPPHPRGIYGAIARRRKSRICGTKASRVRELNSRSGIRDYFSPRMGFLLFPSARPSTLAPVSVSSRDRARNYELFRLCC